MSVPSKPICWRVPGQAGVSLIELVIFIVIISVGIAGLLSVMNLTTRSSADPMLRKQALAVAEAMLEEIQLKDFHNPVDPNAFTSAVTPPIQADRINFDDIGDYHGFSTDGVFAIDGSAPLPGLGSYSVNVTVVNAALGSITAASGNAKRISVTVSGPADTVVMLEGYRTNYAP